MSITIIEMFIPKSNTFTRPGIKRTPKSITIHETANTSVRANALAHAKLQYNGNRRQASWNYSVDDEQEVYLSIPDNEITYHAGNSKGNRESISIEVCVNQDGNFKKAVSNTIQLVRYLIEKYPSIKDVDVVQHHYWSGKDCPKYLRAGTKGIDWKVFIDGVRKGKAEVKKPTTPPKYEQSSGNYKIGDKVVLKTTASRYATGQNIPSQYKGKTYTVMQRGSNRILLKELYSWVYTKDIQKANSSSTNTPQNKPNKTTTKPKQKTNTNTFSVGNKVKIKQAAKTYATGQTIPNQYKNKPYTIQQVKSDRVLLKELYSWVRKSDIVGGTTSNSNEPSPAKVKSYKVGGKATIKKSAKTYATGQTIPSWVKGKTYTIQQIKSDQILLKEIYSWVRKKDLN